MAKARKVGWYVWAVNSKGTFVCVSGCFETQKGAEAYRALYEKNYPNSNPSIEQHAMNEA